MNTLCRNCRFACTELGDGSCVGVHRRDGCAKREPVAPELDPTTELLEEIERDLTAAGPDKAEIVLKKIRAAVALARGKP